MSDIAQTLRQWATVLKIPSGNFVNEDLRFAADEIDRLRDLEAAIYGFVLEHNPGRFEAAEGFGEHVHGPARERIIAQVAAERDQLRAIQGA